LEATEIATPTSTPLSKANIGLKMKCFDFYSTLPFRAASHYYKSVLDKNNLGFRGPFTINRHFDRVEKSLNNIVQRFSISLRFIR